MPIGSQKLAGRPVVSEFDFPDFAVIPTYPTYDSVVYTITSDRPGVTVNTSFGGDTSDLTISTTGNVVLDGSGNADITVSVNQSQLGSNTSFTLNVASPESNVLLTSYTQQVVSLQPYTYDVTTLTDAGNLVNSTLGNSITADVASVTFTANTDLEEIKTRFNNLVFGIVGNESQSFRNGAQAQKFQTVPTYTPITYQTWPTAKITFTYQTTHTANAQLTDARVLLIGGGGSGGFTQQDYSTTASRIGGGGAGGQILDVTGNISLEPPQQGGNDTFVGPSNQKVLLLKPGYGGSNNISANSMMQFGGSPTQSTFRFQEGGPSAITYYTNNADLVYNGIVGGRGGVPTLAESIATDDIIRDTTGTEFAMAMGGGSGGFVKNYPDNTVRVRGSLGIYPVLTPENSTATVTGWNAGGGQALRSDFPGSSTSTGGTGYTGANDGGDGKGITIDDGTNTRCIAGGGGAGMGSDGNDASVSATSTVTSATGGAGGSPTTIDHFGSVSAGGGGASYIFNQRATSTITGGTSTGGGTGATASGTTATPITFINAPTDATTIGSGGGGSAYYSENTTAGLKPGAGYQGAVAIEFSVAERREFVVS
tara:strand:- start:2704 stop:4491 length:1788 start_codon:yes stop_codon:yes gene_type:complete